LSDHLPGSVKPSGFVSFDVTIKMKIEEFVALTSFCRVACYSPLALFCIQGCLEGLDVFSERWAWGGLVNTAG
jgi:hypothetical protein